MRGRWSVVSGIGALAVGGLIAAGCVTPPPPAPASLAGSPNPAGYAPLPPPYNPMPQDLITVTNTGGHTATNVVVHGVGVYSVPSSTCSALAPGATCQAEIQFCPTTSGNYNTTLTVTGTDASTGAPIESTTQLVGSAT